MKSKVFSIIVGIIIVAIGVGYALSALEIIDHFTVFFKGWWTVFIILPGLVMLFTRGANKFVSLCLISLGAVLFLQQNDVIGDIKKFIIPALIILFGASIILNTLKSPKKNITFTIPEIPQDGSIPVFEGSFGEVKPDYNGKVFPGCSMDVTFGAGHLDLRNSIIDNDVTISINTAFAGVDIFLPSGCRVDLQTSASFGGVDNKYISSDMPDAPVVHIYVAVSFGGVDIK